MFNYFTLHIIVVISWVLFLLHFIKALQHGKYTESYFFGLLSLFFLIIGFFLGIKLISLNMNILKTGGWLHLKISLASILALENIYFLLKFIKKRQLSKKILEISYWISYIIFIFILYLTLQKPF